MATCDDCNKTPCNNGDDCWYLHNHSNGCDYCHCSDEQDEYGHLEVRVWSSPIYPQTARDLVEQGVGGVLCGGEISDNAKKIFDDAGIWYEENVEPEEFEGGETEGDGE